LQIPQGEALGEALFAEDILGKRALLLLAVAREVASWRYHQKRANGRLTPTLSPSEGERENAAAGGNAKMHTGHEDTKSFNKE